MKENHQKNNLPYNVWIVIPAYNEESMLGSLLDELCSKNYSLIVVDDCSRDATCDIAMQYPVVVLRHTVNLGQGAALQTAFDYITANSEASCVVTFDSDGQHTVEDIQKVIEPVLNGNFDAVLGSRFLNSTYSMLKKNGMPFSKYLTLKLGVLFTRVSTGLKVTDTHNGLRAFSASGLKRIQITQNRMAHGSEILTQIARAKIQFCEVPVKIAYTDYSRKKGQSIFNSINIIWDLLIGSDE